MFYPRNGIGISENTIIMDILLEVNIICPVRRHSESLAFGGCRCIRVTGQMDLF